MRSTQRCKLSLTRTRENSTLTARSFQLEFAASEGRTSDDADGLAAGPTPSKRRVMRTHDSHFAASVKHSDRFSPARASASSESGTTISGSSMFPIPAFSIKSAEKRSCILVSYAQSSAKYLAGIESVVRRARYLAGKDGRAGVRNPDIKRAIQDGVIPSDSALARAIAQPERPDRRRGSSRLKPSLTPPLEPVSDGAVAGEATETFTARKPIGSANQDRARPLHVERELVLG